MGSSIRHGIQHPAWELAEGFKHPSLRSTWARQCMYLLSRPCCPGAFASSTEYSVPVHGFLWMLADWMTSRALSQKSHRQGQARYPPFSLLGGFIPKRPGRPNARAPGQAPDPRDHPPPLGSSLPGPPPGSHRGNFSQQFGQRPRPRPDGARTPFSIFLFERPVQKRHAASLISRFRIPQLLIPPPHPRRLLPLSASFCSSLSGISSCTLTPTPTPPLASRSAQSTSSHLASLTSRPL